MEKYEIDPKLGKVLKIIIFILFSPFSFQFFTQIQEENASHFAEIKKEYEYLNFLLKETEAQV